MNEQAILDKALRKALQMLDDGLLMSSERDWIHEMVITEFFKILTAQEEGCPKCGGKLKFGTCVSNCPDCGWQGDESGIPLTAQEGVCMDCGGTGEIMYKPSPDHTEYERCHCITAQEEENVTESDKVTNKQAILDACKAKSFKTFLGELRVIQIKKLEKILTAQDGEKCKEQIMLDYIENADFEVISDICENCNLSPNQKAEQIITYINTPSKDTAQEGDIDNDRDYEIAKVLERELDDSVTIANIMSGIQHALQLTAQEGECVWCDPPAWGECPFCGKKEDTAQDESAAMKILYIEKDAKHAYYHFKELLDGAIHQNTLERVDKKRFVLTMTNGLEIWIFPYQRVGYLRGMVFHAAFISNPRDIPRDIFILLKEYVRVL